MKILKYASYNTLEQAIDDVNTKIYPNPNRKLVQIMHDSSTFIGSSLDRYVVMYNEEDVKNEK